MSCFDSILIPASSLLFGSIEKSLLQKKAFVKLVTGLCILGREVGTC